MSKKLITEFPVECKICGKEFKKLEGLSKHLNLVHDINPISYTKEYLLNNVIPKCQCGCGKDTMVYNYRYNEWYRGHTGGGNWQLMYDKNSPEYLEIISKISNTVKEHQKENPMDRTEEQKKKYSEARKKWTKENPDKVAAQIKKMTETKRKQSEDGTLSKRHWTKTKNAEEVELILQELGRKSSETKRKRYESGELSAWNKGLDKETDSRVAKAAENRKGKGSVRLKELWADRKKEKYAEYFDLIDKPETWKILCEDCGEKFRIYERFISFWHAIRKQASGERNICCQSCINMGRIYSEEQKLRMSESAKNRKIDPETDRIKRENQSIRMREYHSNMSEETRIELTGKILEGQWNKPREQIEAWLKKRSDKRKEEMKRLGQSDKFAPSYNPDTIPYIVDILNVRYDTEFMHAESEFGEFKIYDTQAQRFYYADAYCPNLNIWVEFDESRKFRKGKLPSKHLVREDRIREILNCTLLRIEFNPLVYEQ